jgi:spermidine synthase
MALRYSETYADRIRLYDVVVLDGSDPVGPSEGLFDRRFYAAVKKCLAPGGVFALQSECRCWGSRASPDAGAMGSAYRFSSTAARRVSAPAVRAPGQKRSRPETWVMRGGGSMARAAKRRASAAVKA